MSFPMIPWRPTPRPRLSRRQRRTGSARISRFWILPVDHLPNLLADIIREKVATNGLAVPHAGRVMFIGLGVPAAAAELGIMVAEGAGFMVSGEWWIALFPGLALMIAVFCFNLLGDGLRDIVDPQRRT